jgi:amphi-Trp domain-containing protein
MSEETLFKTEKKMSSAEISEYLKMIANKFETEDTINLKSGDQKVELEPQGEKEFEVKVERETSSSGDETSLELEIEWKEGSDNSHLEIE